MWTALEVEKEPLPNKNSEINPEEETPLITKSYLMNQIILLPAQGNFVTCVYIRTFMSDL